MGTCTSSHHNCSVRLESGSNRNTITTQSLIKIVPFAISRIIIEMTTRPNIFTPINCESDVMAFINSSPIN